jgi:hypothetical protein
MKHRVVTLRIAALGWSLAAFAAALACLSVSGQVVKYAAGHDSLYGLVPLFDLDREANVPTFFSALLLFGASVLLAVIAHLKRADSAPFATHWGALAAIFLFLAFDEASSIHELLMRPADGLAGDRRAGVFHFSWVIPAMAGLAVLGAAYLRFWLHLPRRTRWLVFASASIYVGGAVGMEMVGGRYASRHGVENLAYNLVATVEETMEMAGMVLFIVTLLSYLAATYGPLELRLVGGGGQERASGLASEFEVEEVASAR